MMMRRLVAIGLVVVAVCILAVVRIWDSTTDNKQRNTEPTPAEREFVGLSTDIRTDSITEVVVEFGEVSYGATVTEHIRLRNTTDKPLSLTDYQATCRCTWVELPRYPIAPDAWAEVEISFDSRGEFGTVGNYVEVSTSDKRCRIAFWTCADVIN